MHRPLSLSKTGTVAFVVHVRITEYISTLYCACRKRDRLSGEVYKILANVARFLKPSFFGPMNRMKKSALRRST